MHQLQKEPPKGFSDLPHPSPKEKKREKKERESNFRGVKVKQKSKSKNFGYLVNCNPLQFLYVSSFCTLTFLNFSKASEDLQIASSVQVKLVYESLNESLPSKVTLQTTGKNKCIES